MMHSLKGKQVSMIGHGPPTQQGAHVMNSSFDHGTDAERQNSLVDHDNMIQLNVRKCMPDNSSHVGQRCQRLGCSEFVECQAVFCKSHIVGPRCQMLGCPHIVPYGSALCMSHGGGRPYDELGSSTVASGKSEASIKYEGDNGFIVTGNASNTLGLTGVYSVHGEIAMCKHEGCGKRAQGNTVYCKAHSGVSKRCMVQGCTKGAHGGTPICIAHGGGKRCVVAGCPNAACGSSQGLIDRCVRHGGGRRCNYDGCGKGAQGNTEFCIAHGGGRRCKYERCEKSAQGRTDYCIKHGGGRRCKFQGCSKSAKWGMDFCSVHRKNLLHASSADEMFPVPLPKRRSRKANPVESPGPSRKVVIMPAMRGRRMPDMAIIRFATAGPDPDHEKSPETLVMKHISMAHQPLLQSSTEALPLGLTTSTEGEAAPKSRPLFGL
ncbi:unnamed protein product [Urochloa decumbens]